MLSTRRDRGCIAMHNVRRELERLGQALNTTNVETSAEDIAQTWQTTRPEVDPMAARLQSDGSIVSFHDKSATQGKAYRSAAHTEPEEVDQLQASFATAETGRLRVQRSYSPTTSGKRADHHAGHGDLLGAAAEAGRDCANSDLPVLERCSHQIILRLLALSYKGLARRRSCTTTTEIFCY